MRVLVTGGAGYIGSFTTRALQAAGHEVVVFDRLSFGHPEAIDAELVVADLADSAALDRCLRGGRFDAILHFAGSIEAGESMKDAARFFANNTANSVSLLNAAVLHGIQQFVFSSTAGVYGNPVRLPIQESDSTVPTNTYAETKLQVERALPWYEIAHGIRSVPLRYFNAAGAALDGSMGQDHEPATHLITNAIQAMLGRREGFMLFGADYDTPDGTCIRDYIHVLDLADAHVMALGYLAGGGSSRTFNVGAGAGSSNWEVIDSVNRVAGRDLDVQIAPRRAGDPVGLVADTTRIRETLGWQTHYSDLDTIVATAWEWHRNHPLGYASVPVKAG